MSLNGTLTATAGLKLPEPTRAGFADKLYGWMAVTRLRTTSRFGPPVKMSGEASSSRRLAG